MYYNTRIVEFQEIAMYISKISVTNNFVDSNINFSAKQRVSKNLERFFDFNKERMPVTVRKFIEKEYGDTVFFDDAFDSIITE